jgi:transketolase
MVMDMRSQLARTSSDLLDRDPRVAVLLAEITIDRFADVARLHPGRVINVGIMEQTLVGAAAGFAMEGFHTIVHTIAPFLVERPYEQLKDDFGYQGLGGTLASVGAPYDYGTEGGTHHAPGDVGAMLQIPGAQVLVPGTAEELDTLLRTTYANGALTYLRASVAQNSRSLDVAPGHLERIQTGSRATVLAFGPMLDRTVVACEGLDVTVCYATSVEPFDHAGLAEAVGKMPLVVPVEPWYEGASVPAIAHALRDRLSQIVPIGVPHRFIRDYGTLGEHDHAIGLDAEGIRRRLLDTLERSRARP